MTAFDGEASLEELRWLERLALRLVADPNDASDLAQEALLAAELAARRLDGVAPERRRPWLAGTLRNLARRAARGRALRPGYEARGNGRDEVPSPEQLAERAEEQQRLLAALRRLPDRYRTALLLRYYHGLTAARIAAEQAVPVRTVHTRLSRGLQRLRDALDDAHPDGRAGWVSALLPLWSGPPPAAHAQNEPTGPPALSNLGATALLSGAALLTLGLVLGVRVGLGSDGLRDATEVSARTEAPSGRLHVTPTALRSGAGGGRTPLSARSPEGEGGGELAREVHGAPVPQMSLRVIDWEGRPFEGGELRARAFHGIDFPRDGTGADLPRLGEPVELLGWARDGARWSGPATNEDTLFSMTASGITTALARVHRISTDSARASAPGVLVVAPSRDFRLQVVDHTGLAVTGAAAAVVFPESVAARFDWSLAGAFPLRWDARVDGDALAFDAVPWVREAQLVVTVPGRPHRRLALVDAPAILRLSELSLGRVRGRIVDPTGDALRAYVTAVGAAPTRTRPDGTFEIEVPLDTAALHALAEGWAPIRIPVPLGAVRDAAHHGVGTVVAEYPTRTIEGRVLDARGAPLEGLHLWIDDPTLVDFGGRRRSAEAFLSKGDAHAVRTRADGSFRLDGVDPRRRYTLRVLDPETAAWEAFESLACGPGHQLVFDLEHACRALGGRIVDDLGRPVAAAEIHVSGPGYRIDDERVASGSVRVTSGADGSFRIRRVPRTGVSLAVSHPELIGARLPVEALRDGADWQIPRIAQLQVVSRAGDPPRHLRVLNAEDQTLQLRLETGVGYRPTESVDLVDGRSPVITLGTDARVVVLTYRDGRERRLAIIPKPGQVTRMEL